MKKLLAIATVTVFALSFGLAVADEMPGPFIENKDLGWELNESFVTHDDVGMKGAKGAAAGGISAEKVVTRAIDDRTYLGAEGSDLP